MTFKNMNINRSKIDGVIQEWAGLDRCVEPVKKGSGYHYCVPKDESEALLVMYFKNDGTTTIDITAGKDIGLSKEIAEYIKDKCVITKRKNFSLSFKNVCNEDFSLLLEFLNDEVGVKVIEDNISDGRRLIRLKGPFKDEIVITYFANQTVQAQGKPLNLYTEVKLFFYEILSFEQIVKTESETYKININPTDIRSELESYLPTAFSFLDEKLIKILTPSLSLVKLEIELEDYTSFVFPVLRGLEGYIRQILKSKGNNDVIKNANVLGKLFKEDTNNYSCLQDFAKSDINCEKTCGEIERAYNFWKSKRHPYFHVDKYIQMTPMIYKKETAGNIIHETLSLIEDSFSKMSMK